MPALALSRVGTHVVESSPGGQDLAAGAWQRPEALPDPALSARADLPAGPPARPVGPDRYRAPDEKTTGWSWTAWTRGPWSGPCSAATGAVAGRPRPGVRGYHARRAAGQAKMLARGRLRAVAVDGKTARGTRRPTVPG